MQTYGACRMGSVTKQHDSPLVPRLELWSIVETILRTSKSMPERLFCIVMPEVTMCTDLDELLRGFDQFTSSVIPVSVL